MSYLAYGLRVASDIPLPELQRLRPDGRPPDVTLQFTAPSPMRREPSDWVLRLERATGESWLLCARADGGYFLRFVDAADFLVHAGGRAIDCCATTLALDDSDLRHLALDQVMPLVLKLRGQEPLHASAIATPAGICAFLGPGGAGKSTLAAAFLRRGFAVISDDCLPIADRDGVFTAVPAYPGVRLWDDTRKRRWVPPHAVATFPAGDQPLKRIYRVTRASGAHARRAGVESMRARDAVMELVSSTFRFDERDRRAMRRELQLWVQLARAVPTRRLWAGEQVESTAACEAVLADLSAG